VIRSHPENEDSDGLGAFHKGEKSRGSPLADPPTTGTNCGKTKKKGFRRKRGGG